ncbi:MAG: outer membrane protein assembly factor BamC [Burkholderiales bacterium]
MRVALGFAVTLVLAACGMTSGSGIDYKSAGKVPALDVPPDLTRPGRDDRYNVPDGGSIQPGTATLSTYTADRNALPRPGSTDILPDSARSRVERAGGERWLVVQESAEKLWPVVREFWQENGFIIRTDRPEAGVMETDWAEDRAKIPNDGIRSLIGRVLDTVYSTGERDKFRTRLERSPDGKSTEIYISHRGMVERIINSARGQEGTMWEPREPSRELEAEFLRRLMARLGTDEVRAKHLVASAPVVPERAQLKGGADGAGELYLDEPFDRAWRRVGLVLDRVGFTVEDRDRSKGLYYVRYVDLKEDEPLEKPGFFARVFGVGASDRSSTAAQYRVLINRTSADASQVQVLNKEGAVDTSGTGKRILTLLHKQLK